MIESSAQWTPEIVKSVVEMVGKLNEQIYPFSIILPVFFIVMTLGLLYYCYTSPGKQSSTYLKTFLAIIYIVSGLQILLGVTMGLPLMFGLSGLLGMWLVSVLLFLDIYWDKTRITFDLNEFKSVKIIGISLMITGMVIYPIVEILMGFNWPDMVLFGAECPTTIFLIGLLIIAVPKTNKLFLIIIALNAIYTGGSFALMGFPVDILYAGAGIIGVLFTIVYWGEIRFFPLKHQI
ncbi:MAG: DUF6064 family protein [Candidatus Hodarchaeales archaeon]